MVDVLGGLEGVLVELANGEKLGYADGVMGLLESAKHVQRALDQLARANFTGQDHGITGPDIR